jgi:flagellin-like protein
MKFGKNDEAVSPVIGVILMVAITVILAAVIAAFVFGMGPPKQAPQASIRASQVENATLASVDIVLQHQGGADITLSDAKIIVEQGLNRSTWATAGNTTNKFVSGDTMRVYVNGAYNVTVNGQFMQNTTFTGGFIPLAGTSATISIIDVPSGQMVASAQIKT